MSGINDINGNPLQINAIYRNIIYTPGGFISYKNSKLKFKYLGYRPDGRMLVFELDNGNHTFKKIDSDDNNFELINKAVSEPPSATPTQPPISEEKGSEEKGGKRRKSRKSKKIRKSRKSKKTRKSRR